MFLNSHKNNIIKTCAGGSERVITGGCTVVTAGCCDCTTGLAAVAGWMQKHIQRLDGEAKTRRLDFINFPQNYCNLQKSIL